VDGVSILAPVRRILVMLVVLAGIVAGGCGGSGGSTDKAATTSTTTTSTTSSSSGAAASTDTGSGAAHPSSSEGGGTRSSQSGQDSPHSGGDRYQGVFKETYDLCSLGSVQRVAASVGTKSTDHTEIARAMAHGYLPKYRKRAFSGCLSGLKVAAAHK
jgi:hypothetical protein